MRILHTMLRVGDLDKAIAFYTEIFNMTLLRRKDYPKGEFTLPLYKNPSLNFLIERCQSLFLLNQRFPK